MKRVAFKNRGTGFKKRVHVDAAQNSQLSRARKAALRASGSLNANGSRKRCSKRALSNQYKEEQWKKAVRARDGFQCQFRGCWVRDRSIDAHHIAMRSRRPDLKFVQTNGIALCREHHTWVHSHQAEAVAMGLLSEDSYEKAQKEKQAA